MRFYFLSLNINAYFTLKLGCSSPPKKLGCPNYLLKQVLLIVKIHIGYFSIAFDSRAIFWAQIHHLVDSCISVVSGERVVALAVGSRRVGIGDQTGSFLVA